MTPLILGFVGAFLLTALPGRQAIALLKKLGAKQTISTDAPTTHAAKQGTPTMGGLMILAALTLTVLFYVALNFTAPDFDRRIFVVLLLLLAFGVIGFLDDFLSAKRGKNLGLRAREKFAAQSLLALGLMFLLAGSSHETRVTLLPGHIVDFGFWYYPLAMLFLVGLSNATNFTDGVDGLSSGVTLLICLALVSLTAVLYPAMAFFCVALAGGLAGFLWWNAHPAKVFMGDTGSLALGAALTTVALLTHTEVALMIASLVCWAELFSVMMQVTVFKWRRKTKGLDYAKAHRVFRRSPLHHHFEECGWSETQVTLRFCLTGAVCAALALFWKQF